MASGEVNRLPIAEDELYGMCRDLAKNALWVKGAASDDVVSTVATQFLRVLHSFAKRLGEDRQDLVICALVALGDSASYLMDGGAVAWFERSLEELIPCS